MSNPSSQSTASPADSSDRRPGFTLRELVVSLGIVAIVVAFFMHSVRTSREAARRTVCKGWLKHISLALHNYHDTYGAFPPAYTVDAEGNRLHSWRTLILPYLDRRALYEQIDLSKPWNDPANAEAFETGFRIYRCPSAPDLPNNHTTYLAIVAPDSIFQPEESRQFTDITDGPGNTLMVIEVDASQSVPWMSPMDAGESEVFDFSPQTDLPHEGGVYGMFADGTILYLSAEMPSSERQALITISGGDNSPP